MWAFLLLNSQLNLIRVVTEIVSHNFSLKFLFISLSDFSFWKSGLNWQFVTVLIIDDLYRSKASQKSHKNAKSSPSRFHSSVITDASKDGLACRRSAKNSTAEAELHHQNSRSLSAEKRNRSYSRSLSPQARARDRSSDRSVYRTFFLNIQRMM